jgi:hypothetical protein
MRAHAPEPAAGRGLTIHGNGSGSAEGVYRKRGPADRPGPLGRE